MTQVEDVIVVSHTHWDREWYRTFQCFRYRLVDMMDRLLELLHGDPEFVHFLLDGQSVLVEDYLSVRPERAGEVRQWVEQGRLGIGPWYVQPDEFLVSGEALIRNLVLGHRVAASVGGSIKVGWLPDTFGHVAQLPQILQGFGIDTFVFSRGLGDHLDDPVLEFWWEAPDGSRVLALHQKGGYWNAGCLGYPYFWGDACSRTPDAGLALARLKDLVAELEPLAASPTVAVWNGADHLPPQESLPDLIACLDEQLPECSVRHGRIEDYAAAVRESESELPVVRGELRGSRHQNLHASTLSSRIRLKQANHRTQRLLERYAEPLASVAWLLGNAYPDRRLWESWRLLLRNHPHDTICGCSIDQVYLEMLPRFRQAEQIGNCVVDGAFEALGRQIDTGWCPADSIPLLVFNPLAQKRREVVETTLRLPQSHPWYGAVDHGGRSAPVDILSERVESYPWLNREIAVSELSGQIPFWRECLRELDGLDIAGFELKHDVGAATLSLRLAEWPLGSDQVVQQLSSEASCLPPQTQVSVAANYVAVRLALYADLPSCGYAVYALKAIGETTTRQPLVYGDDGSLENDSVRVEVDGRGWFALTDKGTQQRFEGLHQFEDMADGGDCYDFCPLPGSVEGEAVVQIEHKRSTVEATSLVRSLELKGRLRVPASLSEDRRSRSAAQVEIPIKTVLRLKAGARYVEVLTSLDNEAQDHRLRVLFPTGLDGGSVHADGHFAVTMREAGSRPALGWHQPPCTSQPHHTWCAASDGERGLAVLSEGLPEHAGLQGRDGLVLALTLLRGVGWLSRGDLGTRTGHAGPARPTPDAQCLGQHNFRYGMLPYRTDPVMAGVQHLASAFDTPPIARCIAAQKGKLPPRHSVVALEPGSLVLSALQQGSGGEELLMRFYNASESEVEALIQFGFRVSAVHKVTLAEHPLYAVGVTRDGTCCTLHVCPSEIVALLVRPEGVATESEAS